MPRTRTTPSLPTVLAALAGALAAFAAASPAAAQVYVTTQPVYVQPQPVYVQPQPVYVQPRVYGHSPGFFLRGAIGLGFGNFAMSNGSSDLRLSGLAVQANLGIGFGFTREFALHFDVSGASIASPNVSVGSSSAGTTTATTATTTIVGVGGTYYLMPFNMYVSGSVGAAILAAETSTRGGIVRGESGVGWGVNLMAGKEWFIGGYWGVGVAAQLLYTRTPDSPSRGETVYWNNLAAGVLLSATLY